MPQLTIRFILSRGFIGSAIAAVCDGYLSHTEIRTANGWTGAHIGDGVRERPLDYVQPALDLWYGLDVTQAQYDGVMASCQKRIGCGYNTLDIIGLLFKLRFLSSPHLVICSQMVTDVLMENGIFPLNVQPGFTHLISPRDLHLSGMFRGKLIHKVDMR